MTKKKIFIYVLLVFFASFSIGFGAVKYYTHYLVKAGRQEKEWIAAIDDKKIGLSSYLQYLYTVTDGNIKLPDNIKQKILQDLIDRILLDEEAKRLSIDGCKDKECLNSMLVDIYGKEFINLGLVNDSNVASFLFSNYKEFYRVGSYLISLLKKEGVPDQKTLVDYYNKNNELFKINDAVKFYSIKSTSKAKAIEYLKRLKFGMSIEKIKKVAKKDPYVTVNTVGPISTNLLPAPLATQIKTLNKGDNSEIIPLDDGYYIVSIIEKKDSLIPDFNEIKTRVFLSYIKYRLKKIYRNEVARLRRLHRIKIHYKLLNRI